MTFIDTPVGIVRADLDDDGTVTIQNVASYVHAQDVAVDVPGYGVVVGDIAWGGNWFFITHADNVAVGMEHLARLDRFTHAIQDAIRAQGITGANGGDIDHIEVSAAPARSDADCLNYVLCSGGEYDRSPCGTGTSAKMATLHVRDRLAFGEKWHQEGIAGGMFTGWLTPGPNGELIPHIQGSAFITGEATLLLNANDPFRFGISSASRARASV